MKLIGHICCLVYGFILGSLTVSNPAQAQITPDKTLPTPTQPQPTNSGETEINGGTEVGRNLFHSFAEFSVPESQIVRFINNNTAIGNVIGRVTGSSVSEILGTISSGGTSPKFNLFLLNPKGIIFGTKAHLDVRGSFVATTADAIQFGDLGFFSANIPNSSPALLTVDPSAFLFNRIAAYRGSITVNSNRIVGIDLSQKNIFEGLKVPRNQSLLLVGGDINIDGGIIEAPNGRVELGGLAETGTVGLNIKGNILSLSFPDDVIRANVLLTNQASIDVKYLGRGSIAINARNIEMSGGSTLFSGINEYQLLNGDPGQIVLNASETVRLYSSYILSLVDRNAIGDSGNISIKAKSLSVINGGQISTVGFQGKAGDVSLDIDGQVILEGRDTDGTINQINSLLIPDEIDTGSSSGNITIEAGSLSLSDDSLLRTSAFGRGDAGNITVRVNGSITLKGGINLGTQIRSDVEAGAVGNGGTIAIQSRSLSLTDGAFITSSVKSPDEFSSVGGKGNAGDIIVNASDSVNISGVGLNGDPSGIFASINEGAEGQAGNITIDTNSIRLSNYALLSTETGSERGGNINLNVQNLLQLSNNSGISTTSNDFGDAGNININTRFLIGSGNSDITANSNEGQGGAIDITATGVFGLFIRDRETSGNDITAFSLAGAELNGIVELNTPEVDPSRGLIRLPELVIDPSTLITQNICRQGTASELNQTGRGGLPPSVNEALSDDATQVDLVEPVPTRNRPAQENKSSNLNSEQIEPAQGWIFNEKGEVVLTAYNPNITEPQRTRDNSGSCPTM